MVFMRMLAYYRRTLCLLVLALAPAGRAQALEQLLVNYDGREQKLSGQVVIEDTTGSLLLETDEGALWPLAAETILERTSDEQQLVPLNKKQLTERLLQELGPEFQSHDSKHYIVVFNTTRRYAIWCSTLLEKLQKGFLYFWKKRGAKVHAPQAPLAVLIFNNKASYIRHAQAELGAAAGGAIGYYSLQTNRIVMYDLTGEQALLREETNRGSMKDITALLKNPRAEPLVATIIHEATHQIAYNCGLQKRFVDNPVWLSEGMAVYFETPNLDSNRLWSGTDKVNTVRWERFRQNASAGKVASLKTLIADDQRLRHPQTAIDGYAEAWAWNYFLIKWHPKKYAKYLAAIANKPLLMKDDRKRRIADFQAHFGEDLGALEAQFFRRMAKVK
jgi:hypothetical protein